MAGADVPPASARIDANIIMADAKVASLAALRSARRALAKLLASPGIAHALTTWSSLSSIPISPSLLRLRL